MSKTKKGSKVKAGKVKNQDNIDDIDAILAEMDPTIFSKEIEKKFLSLGPELHKSILHLSLSAGFVPDIYRSKELLAMLKAPNFGIDDSYVARILFNLLEKNKSESDSFVQVVQFLYEDLGIKECVEHLTFVAAKCDNLNLAKWLEKKSLLKLYTTDSKGNLPFQYGCLVQEMETLQGSLSKTGDFLVNLMIKEKGYPFVKQLLKDKQFYAIDESVEPQSADRKLMEEYYQCVQDILKISMNKTKPKFSKEMLNQLFQHPKTEAVTALMVMEVIHIFHPQACSYVVSAYKKADFFDIRVIFAIIYNSIIDNNYDMEKLYMDQLFNILNSDPEQVTRAFAQEIILLEHKAEYEKAMQMAVKLASAFITNADAQNFVENAFWKIVSLSEYVGHTYYVEVFKKFISGIGEKEVNPLIQVYTKLIKGNSVSESLQTLTKDILSHSLTLENLEDLLRLACDSAKISKCSALLERMKMDLKVKYLAQHGQFVQAKSLINPDDGNFASQTLLLKAMTDQPNDILQYIEFCEKEKISCEVTFKDIVQDTFSEQTTTVIENNLVWSLAKILACCYIDHPQLITFKLVLDVANSVTPLLKSTNFFEHIAIKAMIYGYHALIKTKPSLVVVQDTFRVLSESAKFTPLEDPDQYHGQVAELIKDFLSHDCHAQQDIQAVGCLEINTGQL